jgi:hypothetical protein
MRENKVITTREQVIASVQRQEELAEQQSEKEAKPEVKATETPTPDKRIAGASHANRTPTPSPKGKGGKGLKCFNCGRYGHKQNECRAPPKNQKTEDKDK